MEHGRGEEARKLIHHVLVYDPTVREADEEPDAAHPVRRHEEDHEQLHQNHKDPEDPPVVLLEGFDPALEPCKAEELNKTDEAQGLDPSGQVRENAVGVLPRDLS